MIADMTGPNGNFIPRNQAQQFGNYQPLQQSDTNEAMEMRQQQQQQQQSRSHPGYDYQPVQQREGEGGQGQHLFREDVIQRRYQQQLGSGSPSGESASAAIRRGQPRGITGPDGETHPAFRDDPELTTHAI